MYDSIDLCTHTVPPSHVNVLEWRKTLERLNRLTCLCGGLVVQLLQRLVLKAVNTLLFITRRLVRKALARSADQDESFALMRETVTSNPFTQGILDRQDISLDDEAHAGLVSMQASSFSTLLPSLEAGSIITYQNRTCYYNYGYMYVQIIIVL